MKLTKRQLIKLIKEELTMLERSNTQTSPRQTDVPGGYGAGGTGDQGPALPAASPEAQQAQARSKMGRRARSRIGQEANHLRQQLQSWGAEISGDPTSPDNLLKQIQLMRGVLSALMMHIGQDHGGDF